MPDTAIDFSMVIMARHVLYFLHSIHHDFGLLKEKHPDFFPPKFKFKTLTRSSKKCYGLAAELIEPARRDGQCWEYALNAIRDAISLTFNANFAESFEGLDGTSATELGFTRLNCEKERGFS